MKCLNCNCDTDRMSYEFDGDGEPECLECWKKEQPGSHKCITCEHYFMDGEITPILGEWICKGCERSLTREWKLWEYEQLLADEELYFCDDYTD